METHSVSDTTAAAAAAASTNSAAVAAASGAYAAGEVSEAKLMEIKNAVAMEYQLLRIPFEQFKKTVVANDRTALEELTSVFDDACRTADDDRLSKDNAVSCLTELLSRLHGLETKMEEENHAKDLIIQRHRSRLSYIESLSPENMPEWNNKLFQRVLVDYLSRMSYRHTAKRLAESFHIQDLVDTEFFQEAKWAIDALRRKDLGPALEWCTGNRSELEKIKSDIEFKVRGQEFIELVRAGQNVSALDYARHHLAPWGPTYWITFQPLMAILAFKHHDTVSPIYKEWFDVKKWDELEVHFMQAFCGLHGTTADPLLYIYMRYGLYIVKTPDCYKGRCRVEDPLYEERMKKLAMPLPDGVHEFSKLVCNITGEFIDGDNYPQVLPSGYVCGNDALRDMAKRNGGKITCPRTGLVCSYDDLKKIYV